MGRYVVRLPDIGEGTTEAEIVAWHVAVGQEIREEDPLVDIMTDKATVELPAPVGGTVLAINGNPGEKRAVGSELVVLDVTGAGNVADLPGASRSSKPQPKQPLTRPSLHAGHPLPASGERVGPAKREGEGQEINGAGAEVISLARIAGEGAELRAKSHGEAGEGVLIPSVGRGLFDLDQL